MLIMDIAEFRGPGVHHKFEDSDSGNEDSGRRAYGNAGSRGRIIFLGDGNEVLTDSDDTRMFENAAKDEEDEDLQSQVRPGQAASTGTNDDSKASAGAEEPKYQGVSDGPLSKSNGDESKASKEPKKES